MISEIQPIRTNEGYNFQFYSWDETLHTVKNGAFLNVRCYSRDLPLNGRVWNIGRNGFDLATGLGRRFVPYSDIVDIWNVH